MCCGSFTDMTLASNDLNFVSSKADDDSDVCLLFFCRSSRGSSLSIGPYRAAATVTVVRIMILLTRETKTGTELSYLLVYKDHRRRFRMLSAATDASRNAAAAVAVVVVIVGILVQDVDAIRRVQQTTVDTDTLLLCIERGILGISSSLFLLLLSVANAGLNISYEIQSMSMIVRSATMMNYIAKRAEHKI
jgi:hypothetical protein